MVGLARRVLISNPLSPVTPWIGFSPGFGALSTTWLMPGKDDHTATLCAECSTKRIAAPPHGLDILFPARRVSQLLPQFADEHVDDLEPRLVYLSPHRGDSGTFPLSCCFRIGEP